MKHLVNSLKFDLHCPAEDGAFALRRIITEQLQPLLEAAIDKVCTDHVAAGKQLRIDKLELDLGFMSSAALEQQFDSQFREQFEARLLEYLQQQEQPHEAGPGNDPALQVFIHFMETGLLPWWTTPAEQDFEVLCEDLLQRVPAAIITFFKEHASENNIWLRVIRQLDYRFRQFLLDHMQPLKEAHVALIAAINAIHNLLAPQTPAVQSTTGLASDMPVPNTPPKLAGAKDTALVAALLDLLQKYKQDDRIFLLLHAPEIFKAAQPQAIQQLLTALLFDGLAVADDKQYAVLVAEIKAKLQPATEAPVLASGALPATATPVLQAADQAPAAVMPERIMITEAGLVLLGPYLKPLFTALGFWKDGTWQSLEAQEKAACLLKLVATGSKADKEYSLALEKLLCGIPLYQPVRTDYMFSEAEIKEATTLLEAVIANWPALKNTSVEGFRSAFLQRDAVLYAKEQDWQLVVEKKTLDVLLESIPWGYGTLALSWNTYLIFTEW